MCKLSKIYAKAGYHWLNKGGYKTPVHFCNKCEKDFRDLNINIDSSKINIVSNKKIFGLNFSKIIKAKIKEVIKKWNLKVPPEYKRFTCDEKTN